MEPRPNNPTQLEGQNPNQRRTVATGNQNNLPHPPAQPCPRCNSNNTKFCYYNNYSLSQPRYFCKGCRRYWTHGGTLRNVPVGGGSRKRKRPKITSSSPVTRAPPAGFHQQVGGGSNNNNNNSSSSNNNNSNNNGVMSIGQSLGSCGSLLGTPIIGGGGGGANAAAFYGGFLPSLSVNFGSNLGLLHGLGLPNLDPHPRLLPQQVQVQQQQQQQQQQQETMSFQELLHQHHHQNLHHPGLIPTLQAGDNWILSNNSNNNNNVDNGNNNNNNNNSNNEDDPDQWPDFQVGSTGLEDP